jgi:Spy/CpxP family protein refolding chaperone
VKKSILIVPLLTAAALMAQSPTPQPSTQQPSSVQHSVKTRRHDRVQRLSERLNLTPDQQKQIRAMFRGAYAQAKPLRAQLHQERASLAMAVKTDSEQQIDQITRQNADVLAQLQAIHAKTMAKVFSILTPEQKVKFDAMHSPNARARAARAQHNG